jgi:chromosome segregation ATPase
MSSRFDALERRVAKTEERLRRQNERLRRHKELLDDIRPAVYRAQSLFEILGAQVGAMEERLQGLTEKLDLAAFDPTEEEKAEARTLLDEVREEHRRIRVRFGVVTSYEERIRRLESALAEEMMAAAELAREAAKNGALANAPTEPRVDIPETATAAPAAPPRS